MLADGLFTRFPKPDYGFSAHVDPTLARTVHVKQGPTTSAVDTILITFKGVGAHGSMPDKGIDPIVESAHFVTDVQASSPDRRTRGNSASSPSDRFTRAACRTSFPTMPTCN
jgi:metal-dependent amidase/aminoacylase/carboxypeptidase family protein